ncbi:MAG: helix-turn-helix domain-containing protein [Erysipelotrichaceae bacterium]|nr:helix-turn-helix domain-containing protein [Erysipelotrichaceae bacterium]
MGKKTGAAIKKARTEAGMTQEQLARKVKGVSASDISKAERGEKDLTTTELKAIAKATGVTQTSLLNAEKTTTSTSKKKTTTPSNANYSMKVTSTEKSLVTLYRQADADTKKEVMNILKGKENEVADVLKDLLEDTLKNLAKK